MSDHTPGPNATDPQGPAIPPAPAPYGGSYPPQPYLYQAPRRPPLSKRAKRGSLWAGMVGFNLLTVGFYVALIPLIAALFGALFSFIVEQVVRSGRGRVSGAEQFTQFFDSLDYGLLGILGVVAVIVGLGLMCVGLFSSVAILKSHNVYRPWPVTWAGTGVAIVGFWVVGWIVPTILQFVSFLIFATGVDTVVALSVQGVLMFLGLLAGNAIIGWLSWWWMAHALRARADDATTATVEPTTASSTEVQE